MSLSRLLLTRSLLHNQASSAATKPLILNFHSNSQTPTNPSSFEPQNSNSSSDNQHPNFNNQLTQNPINSSATTLTQALRRCRHHFVPTPSLQRKKLQQSANVASCTSGLSPRSTPSDVTPINLRLNGIPMRHIFWTPPQRWLVHGISP